MERRETTDDLDALMAALPPEIVDRLTSVANRTDLLEVVTQLAFVQVDPTAAVAPTADLVAWSRLGGGYRPEHLQ